MNDSTILSAYLHSNVCLYVFVCVSSPQLKQREFGTWRDPKSFTHSISRIFAHESERNSPEIKY